VRAVVGFYISRDAHRRGLLGDHRDDRVDSDRPVLMQSFRGDRRDRACSAGDAVWFAPSGVPSGFLSEILSSRGGLAAISRTYAMSFFARM